MTAEVQEKWLKWVALTTTILAVCTAFASLKSGGASTQVQLLTTKESDQWSFYQAKSLKLHLTEMESDLLKAEVLNSTAPAVTASLQGTIKSLDKDAAKYDKEKDEIKAQAEAIESQQAGFKHHGGNFGLAVMYFQIAITLSAIGSLIKQRGLWLVGLVIGAIGIVYFINGFYLFF